MFPGERERDREERTWRGHFCLICLRTSSGSPGVCRRNAWNCFNCDTNFSFGCASALLFFTRSSARSYSHLFVSIRYAITTADERDRPCEQCTRTHCCSCVIASRMNLSASGSSLRRCVSLESSIPNRK